MKLPKRATVAVDAACLVVLGWLYLGDVVEYRHAVSAEVAAMTALPNLWFALLALAVTAAVMGVAAWGVFREKPDTFRGYRLVPIAFVALLFVDLFVISGARGPAIPSADRLSASMQLLASAVQAKTSPRGVPTDARDFDEWLGPLGEPPYLVGGKRAARYSVQVRSECEKPVTEAPGLAVGTVLYCVAPHATEGWITVVGLPAGQTYGEPEVFSVNGAPRVWVVHANGPNSEAEEAPGGPQGPVDAGG